MTKLLYIGNKLARHGRTPTSIETLGPLLAHEGYVVTYASSIKNQTGRFIHMLWTVLTNRKADFVLIDTYSTSNFWYAFFSSQLCRLLRMKYIPILHGGNLPARVLNSPIISRLIFDNAYQNVAPSLYLLEKFQEQNFKNLVYIPNGIAIKNYPFRLQKHFEPKLFWVRAFASIYNPQMALQVLVQLKKQFPTATLCMVGPDKDGTLAKVKQMAEDLKVEVVFTGKLFKKEWVTLANDYSIFINTTHFDNTPVSVIEAMALGLAVVSTNVGGMPYLIKNQKEGFLVEDNNTAAMVEVIQKILANSNETKDCVQNARQKAENFDWEVVKHHWFEILK